jgi:hypothetical protein
LFQEKDGANDNEQGLALNTTVELIRECRKSEGPYTCGTSLQTLFGRH